MSEMNVSKSRLLWPIVVMMGLGLVIAACDDTEQPSDDGRDTSDTTDVAVEDTGDDVAGDPDMEDIGDLGDATVVDIFDVAEEINYSAEIRYTSYGIPHISADNFGDLAFGIGWAQARDHICTLADGYVRVRSEQARYFGPGEDDRYINNDFAYLALGLVELAESNLREVAPELREGLAGFAAGYNHFLAQTGVENLPPQCADADWVRPIDAVDVYTYALNLPLLASAQQLIQEIGRAQPPAEFKRHSESDSTEWGGPNLRRLSDMDSQIGSNGVGIGGDLTESGRGMLIGNPHFPWRGELLFWESHQTIPGQMNSYGSSLLGSPLITIGFNEHLAWTHTVSPSFRLVVYMLNLDPSDSTSYRYDSEYRQMTSQEHSIEVRQADGSLETISRTMYRSHYGPMLDVAPIGWSPLLALSLRDANENNTQMADHYLAMNLADDLDSFQATHREINGIPFITTIYADDQGNAFYTDSTQVPNLSEFAISRWLADIETNPITADAANTGAVILNGSDSRFEWVEAPGARIPGNVPADDAPSLVRRDFVANANESHWGTNPSAPLEGYSALYGGERNPLYPRTRTNVMFLTESGDDAHPGGDGLWSVGDAEDLFWGGRTHVAESLVDQVVTRCTGAGPVDVGGDTPIDISSACQVLGQWDGRIRADSRGALVWREFLAKFGFGNLLHSGSLFEVDFDYTDPANTPNTLAAAPATGPDPVLVNLAEAVSTLTRAGVALDARLSDAQFAHYDDGLISIPGGNGYEGAFNIATWVSVLGLSLLPGLERDATVINSRTGLTDEGYLVNGGSSFILVVSFEEDGPQARGLMTYSQSSDPRSPHFEDQFPLYSEERLRPILYDEEDILADPNLEVISVANSPF